MRRRKYSLGRRGARAEIGSKALAAIARQLTPRRAHAKALSSQRTNNEEEGKEKRREDKEEIEETALRAA